MAIVDLGTNALAVGSPPVSYLPFPYLITEAYGIGVVFSTPVFDNIFSFVRVRAQWEVTGLPPFFSADYYDLEVIAGIQIILIPASALYFANGTLTLFAQRRPFYTGAGDGPALTMQLLYDDAVTTPTWR